MEEARQYSVVIEGRPPPRSTPAWRKLGPFALFVGAVWGLQWVFFPVEPEPRMDELFIAADRRWSVQETHWDRFEGQLAGRISVLAVAFTSDMERPSRFWLTDSLILEVCTKLLRSMPDSALDDYASNVFRIEVGFVMPFDADETYWVPVEARERECVSEFNGLDRFPRFPNMISDWPLVAVARPIDEGHPGKVELRFRRDLDAEIGIEEFNFLYACSAALAAPPQLLLSEVLPNELETVTVIAENRVGNTFFSRTTSYEQTFDAIDGTCIPDGATEDA